MPARLEVFIASSSQQVAVADQVAKLLNKTSRLIAKPWTEKVFQFSKPYIESLERELDEADFAIVVLTGDDAAIVRDKAQNLPRDNVIFELGLFWGRLGHDRCFFLIDGGSDTKIASDLTGVKSVTFFREGIAGGPSKPDLETQLKDLINQMLDQKARYKPTQSVRERQEMLWRFSTRLAGHWWERMRIGEDDMSALSYMTVTVDQVTNTPHFEGKAYDTTGESLAGWESISTGVDLRVPQKPKVSYRWEGKHERQPGQKIGGSGMFIFDDEYLQSGEGEYYDTNLGRIDEGAPTRFKHCGLYRCDPADVRIMKKPWTKEAAALINEKLHGLRGR